ncbi:MAG: BON domain-containing protein [Methylobacter sp.]|nr:BON domain-containing protein [Methylobacter sp.]MDP2098815.1 BON domain-containing protein [Methylobacter sp.]MDP2428538.1 BON domain-containing protein [Methylobacter sp.]MDP3054106.1 BON domain-containing protein [Methylobacter sp.]MDP3363120.1 BON domain-containing protein [Methylobacter sp.]
MYKRLLLIMFGLTGSLIMMAGTAQAEQNTALYLAAESELENTELNARDKDSTTLTPIDQKENKADIDITAAIRKKIIRDKHLSVNAQNVKIITRNGVVTLRGPVNTKKESKRIQKIAKKIRGVVRIDNQLEIKAP